MANEPTVKEEISLKELLKNLEEWYYFFLSKWKTILLAAIVGACLGLTYSFVKKPIYTATLSFAFEGESSGGSGGVLSLASQFGLDIGGSGGSMFSGGNLIELFKSRSMLEQTLMKGIVYKGDTISLAEMYIQNMEWRKKWNNKPKFKNIHFIPNTKRKYFSRVHDSILGLIYKDLSENELTINKIDKKLDIVNIDMISTNELFAKYFVENLAIEVSTFYIDTKSKKARINMEILERQTDSVRAELNGAITGVAVANDNNFNLNPALNVRRTPSAKRQVDVQANIAILTELVKQTELAKVTYRKETPIIQIIDKPILPLKKERVGKLKGIIIGGFLAGLLAVFVLSIKRMI